MASSGGFVTSENAVEGLRLDGDTAEVRRVIDASVGCERLEQEVIRFSPGRSRERGGGDRQEVLYVASGNGTLHLEGAAHALEPNIGVFICAGERYTIENPGPDELRVVAVTAPQTVGVGEHRRVTVRYADSEPLPATANREFRYLVNEDAGCLEVTQFVGLIPPSKAPPHVHPYDEVVYVVEGTGVVHLDGEAVRMGPGTCIHLPPQTPHCLENDGEEPVRVLGVFHPSGSPAAASMVNK
jgi:mannose-6-phosphate isomerase-like protein (cupin superfamily)